MTVLSHVLQLALTLGAGTASQPDVVSPADRVAINPNLPFSACDGGANALTVGQALPIAAVRGFFIGQLPPAQVLDGSEAQWCPGTYPPQPQVCLIVRDAGEYRIEVTDSQDIDTVLAVEIQPDYFYCDDDSGGGLRPLVVSWLEPGQYRVFIGAYSQGSSGAFTLAAGPQVY